MFLFLILRDCFALSCTSVCNKNKRYFIVISRNRIFQKLAFSEGFFAEGSLQSFVRLHEYLVTWLLLDHLKSLLVDARQPSIVPLTSWRIVSERSTLWERKEERGKKKKVRTHVYLRQGGLAATIAKVSVRPFVLFRRFAVVRNPCARHVLSFSLSISFVFSSDLARTICIPQHDICPHRNRVPLLSNVFGFFFLLNPVLTPVRRDLFFLGPFNNERGEQ